MITHAFGRIPAAVVLAVVLAFPGSADASHCPAFPRVVWWGELTHQTAAADVEHRYGGDWKPAIKSWQKNLTKLQTIRDKGGTAGIRYKSTVKGRHPEKRLVRLSGVKLERYIENVWKRMAVMYCLADQPTAQAR